MIVGCCTAGLRMKNLDVGALQAVFEVLQQHYPERLGELWFLNAPFIFWGLWRVVSPFIQQATKEKIKFLSGREREQMLQQYIPQDVSFLSCRQFWGNFDLNMRHLLCTLLTPR